MIRLVRAEFLKLRTTQVWLWMLVADVAVGAAVAIGSLASSDAIKEPKDVPYIFATSNGALITVFVVGILGITTEYRYQTITPTVLITPSRWTIITAKLSSSVLMGLFYALLCTVVALAMALPWLSSDGIGNALGDNWSAVIEAFVVVALYALLGLGAGALLKNQIVAVVVGLIFLVVVQNIVLAIPGVKYAYAYLPAGLERAITLGSGPGIDRTPNGVHLFPVWGGIIGFVIWGTGLAVLGAGLTMNRDIT